MSKLKVYVVNYDGRTSRMVAATSQKAAAELMRTTLSNLRNYGHTGTSAVDSALALSAPGAVYSKSFSLHSEGEPLEKRP